ncbi:RHS repeat domain-containing protein, partial [Elizabethkingia anophelis]
MDQLGYTYDQSGNSNKLIRVNDASGNAAGYPVGGNTIGYDINGNMVNHLDKGISNIAYNYLNLPSSITASIGNTDYVYRADGTKVRKVFGGKTTDYLDGFQYENGVLQFVPTSEGYYDVVKNKYIYNYTDHLGNVRLSYTKGASGGAEIIEENNYYPFGLKHQGYNSSSLANSAYQYKYNGKELQETGMYDYGARMYMPDLGRWGVVDKVTEFAQNWSPYRYAYNNPIKFYDPTGLFEDEKKPDPKKVYEGGEIQEVVLTKYRPLEFKPAQPTFGSVLQEYRDQPGITMPGNMGVADGKWMFNAVLDLGNALRNFIGFGRDKSGPAGERWTKLDGYPMGGQEQQTQAVNMLLTLFGNQYGLASKIASKNSPNLLPFSGSEKAWKAGATPNSIYTYLSGDGETAVSNYIYNNEGKVIFQVDFQKHGLDWLSGHGHKMSIPGNFGSGHILENHVPHTLVPADYKVIPPNTNYSQPLAK